jgi:purine-binding chemotaxis protein CheW
MGDSGGLRHVFFRLGDTLCAVPVSAVREVIPAGRITRIPGAGETVAGLVNVRGTLLTVVDGRTAIGVQGAEEPESILVLVHSERAFGVVIDQIIDLADLGPDDIRDGEPPRGFDPRYAGGVGTHRGRPFVVVNTDALLAPVVG